VGERVRGLKECSGYRAGTSLDAGLFTSLGVCYGGSLLRFDTSFRERERERERERQIVRAQPSPSGKRQEQVSLRVYCGNRAVLHTYIKCLYYAILAVRNIQTHILHLSLAFLYPPFSSSSSSSPIASTTVFSLKKNSPRMSPPTGI